MSSTTTCESLDLVNSTSTRSVVDGASQSITDCSPPVTSDHTLLTASVTATKQMATTPPSDETDPRDIVARIYREELQKLAATAKTNGNFAEYVMYEGELERLSQSSTLAVEPLPVVSSPAPARKRKDGRSKRSVPTAVGRRTTPQTVLWCAIENPVVDRPEDLTTRSSQSKEQQDVNEHTSNQSDITALHMLQSSPDTNCAGTNLTLSTDLSLPAAVAQQDAAMIVKSEQLSDDVDVEVQQLALNADGDCSPLDLMRTIADSVTSKSHKKSTSAETTRYALPPITSDQLKRCSYLNTDEVVAAVRSTLADYSISQRLFGEAVLGLSQASSVTSLCYISLHV